MAQTKKPHPLVSFALGIISFAILGAALWWLVSTVTSYIGELQNPATGAVIAASITGLVSVVAVLLAKAHDRRLAADQALRAKKAPLYEMFIGGLMEFLLTNAREDGTKPLKVPSTDPTAGIRSDDGYVDPFKLFLRFNREVLLWGGDDVLREWSRFKTFLTRDQKPLHTIFELYGNLILALRREYGHKNRNISVATIARTFVNDYDSLSLPPPSNTSRPND